MAKLGDDMQNGPSSVAVIKNKGEKKTAIYLVKATHEVRICTNEHQALKRELRQKVFSENKRTIMHFNRRRSQEKCTVNASGT
jgi:hypothetical protein